MINNPQINNFLNAGIKRFAERGIDGIKVDEICDEVGVAKSSFYHYFGGKNGFVEKLFDYWYDITHGEVSESLSNIDDATERFLALKKMIDANEEVEFCFLQIKLYAATNAKAKEIIERTNKTRFDVLYAIFNMAGQSDEEARCSAKKMTMLYYGKVALKHGYSGPNEDFDITKEQYLEFLGLKKP